MAGEDGRRHRSCTTVAVILVLCSLAQSISCFSLPWFFKDVDQDKVVNEATVMEVKDGSILFDGKKLDSQSGSASAASTESEGLLHADLDQLDAAGVLGQTSQLENAIANEAAWRHLKSSLHCGQNQMKFKAMGPEAAYLQLDMGNAHLLPLNQVPETCNYTMKSNSLGLILVVPYNGCNVIQENGNYVLPMSWIETPIKLACPILKSYAASTSTPKLAQQPWKLPFPHGALSLKRHKRQSNQPLSIYDPTSPYYRYLKYYYNYYMNMMTPAPGATTTAAAATTTAEPDTTTMTTNTMTTKSSAEDPQRMPPANPYPYFYYPYPYYLYYPYYRPLPNAPVTTTTPPATTTAEPTSGPATSGMTTTTMMTTTTSGSTTTTDSGSTTTASPMTTKTTQKPFNPYYPPYFPYPYYPPAGQAFPGMPDNPDVYYYQVIQHYYGKPPYPQFPNAPMQTSQPPTTTTTKPDSTTTKPDSTTTKPDSTTTKPDSTTTRPDTTTTKPDDPTTTTKPSVMSPTTKSTTASTTACDQTAGGVCSTTKPSSNKYPGPMSPYVPYYQLPFVPYVSYKSNKAGSLPDDQKYMPQPGYKSGLQARAHPPPHPGFHYWQPVPWFPHSAGQNNLQFAWEKSTA